jgi:5'-3' exonuclease
VPPALVPDFLALVGDTADGIPGLDGWGEKGAAAVLNAHGRLEEIPDDASAWKARPRGAEKLAGVLRAQRQDALLYRTLATLRTDAPLPGTRSLEDLRFRGVPREAFREMCARLALPRLLERPQRWAQ